MTGTIKKVLADKGYFFIKPDDHGTDVFGHANRLTNANIAALAEGQRVVYDENYDQQRGKMRAVNIEVLEG